MQIKESNIKTFNFVVLSTIAGELTALRPRGELKLTSHSSFIFLAPHLSEGQITEVLTPDIWSLRSNRCLNTRT